MCQVYSNNLDLSSCHVCDPDTQYSAHSTQGLRGARGPPVLLVAACLLPGYEVTVPSGGPASSSCSLAQLPLWMTMAQVLKGRPGRDLTLAALRFPNP